MHSFERVGVDFVFDKSNIISSCFKLNIILNYNRIHFYL